MKTFTLPYGHGTQTFTMADEHVLGTIHMPSMPIINDVKAAIIHAIEHPIGTAPLKDIVKAGDTITFICNDPTRVANSFDFMPVFIDYLNALGVPDENMQIVFALGSHRLMTYDEMVEQALLYITTSVAMVVGAKRSFQDVPLWRPSVTIIALC